MQDKYKVVFIGGQKLGSKVFSQFVKSDNVELGIVYELKLDDHENSNFKSIKSKIDKNKIKCKYRETKLIKEDDIAQIAKYDPDYIFVVNWRTMLSQKVLNIPKFGAIGIHSSDLPKYRGFAPVNWAIINGEKKTAASIFFLGKEVDCGDIIDKKYIKIKQDDDINSLMVKVEDKYRKMFKNILSNLGDLTASAQRGEATYTCKRKPQDGFLDFNLYDSSKIHNLIRGLSHPYPMAFFKYGDKFIFVNKSTLVKEKKYIGIVPGRVVSLNKKSGSVGILCKDGFVIEISEIAVANGLFDEKSKLCTPFDIFDFSGTVNL